MKGTHRIVIVGGGFAGLRTALELVKRKARLRAFEITLVDRETVHVYSPLLYEVCTGGLEKDDGSMAKDLRAGVSVPFSDFERRVKGSKLKFVRGELSGIDSEANEIQLKDGRTLPYDDLVLAFGVVPNTFGIPGVEEHAYKRKWLPDALKIREKLRMHLEMARKGKEKRLVVMVVGGGPTGTEFSAELANFFQRLTREKRMSKDAWQIRLVEAGPSILGNASPEIQKHAVKRLERLGVMIMPKTKMTAVEPGRACLSTDGEEECVREADVIVWAGGIKPSEALKSLKLQTDPKGAIVVDPAFQVKGRERVWALGDASGFVHPKTNARVPQLAQVATREAGIVAENITRALERRPLISWFPPEKWITATPLGGSYAVADFGTFHVAGWRGFIVRKFADLSYFCSILPWRQAIPLWMHGTMVYRKND